MSKSRNLLNNPANKNARGMVAVNILNTTINYTGYDLARQFSNTSFENKVNIALKRVVLDEQLYRDLTGTAASLVKTINAAPHTNQTNQTNQTDYRTREYGGVRHGR